VIDQTAGTTEETTAATVTVAVTSPACPDQEVSEGAEEGDSEAGLAVEASLPARRLWADR